MMRGTGAPHDLTSFHRGRSSRNVLPQTLSGAAALTLSALVGAGMIYARLPAPPPVSRAPVVAAPAIVTSNAYIALLDSTFSLGVAPVSLAESSPLGSNFKSIHAAPPPTIAEPENILPVPVTPVPPLVQSTPLPVAAVPIVASVPLPTPRPPELQAQPERSPIRMPPRRIAQQNKAISLPAPPSDNRTFFQKLFGTQRPSGSVLAYAAPEEDVINPTRRLMPGPSLPYDRLTAVYDISAHTVYLPNGTRLEAHSGLGNRLDDPRYVSERNRGATPPHLYELEPRAQLFHGVRALRLNPVGGGSIFGRTGLLAHTYMLGPSGSSNGCVSFRNYNAFLQAYMNGEVRRLVVVARLN